MKVAGRFKLLRDLIALTTGQFAGKVIGFLAFAYLARVLEPDAYGILEYAVALSVLFAIAIDWGLGPIGVRELAKKPQSMAGLAAMIPSARFILALLAVPVMGFSSLLTEQGERASDLVWLFALGLLAAPWKQDWLLQGREMMNAAAAAQVIRMGVFAAGAVILVHDSDDLLRMGYVELASVAAWAIYFILVQHFWVTPLRFKFSLSTCRDLLRQGFPVGLGETAWAFVQAAPLILVTNLVGGEESAWFAAPQRLLVSLLVFSSVYHFNLYPAITRRVGGDLEELKGLLRASFRVVAWGGILLGLVLALLAEPILTLVFGQPFAVAAPTFALLIWALPITLLSGHARWSLVATGHQKFSLYAQAVGAGIVVVAGLILIPFLESMGAAVVVVLAALGVWVAGQAFARTRVRALPSLWIVALPAGLAALGMAGATSVPLSPWIAAPLLGTVFLLAAFLLDRELLADFKRLAHAKADLADRAEETSTSTPA